MYYTPQPQNSQQVTWREFLKKICAQITHTGQKRKFVFYLSDLIFREYDFSLVIPCVNSVNEFIYKIIPKGWDLEVDLKLFKSDDTGVKLSVLLFQYRIFMVILMIYERKKQFTIADRHKCKETDSINSVYRFWSPRL